MRRTAAAVGCLTALACAVLLLIQGIPDDVSVETTVTTTSNSSMSSGGCSSQCKNPKVTVSDVSVKSYTQGDSGAGGIVEKALDNNVGITVVRLLLALILGLIAAFSVLQLLTILRHGDDPDDGVAVGRPNNSTGGNGETSQRAEKPGIVSWGDSVEEKTEPAEEANSGQANPEPARSRSRHHQI
jgi:hypothetical protein